MTNKELVWPVSGLTSASITCNFYHRVNEGTGGYIANAVIPALVIAFPSGYNDQRSISYVKQLILEHCGRYDLLSVTKPKVGTPMEAIARALVPWIGPTYLNGANYMAVFFDGEFGPVSAG